MNEKQNGLDLVNVWPAIMGSEEDGAVMRICLFALSRVSASSIQETIHRIDRETAIGPITNPSAYLDGRRFKNGDQYIKVLRAALVLRKTLPGSFLESVKSADKP